MKLRTYGLMSFVVGVIVADQTAQPYNKVCLHGPPSSSLWTSSVANYYICFGCDFTFHYDVNTGLSVRTVSVPEWRHKDATSVTNPALTTIVDRDKMLYQVLPSRIFWNAKKKKFNFWEPCTIPPFKFKLTSIAFCRRNNKSFVPFFSAPRLKIGLVICRSNVPAL